MDSEDTDPSGDDAPMTPSGADRDGAIPNEEPRSDDSRIGRGPPGPWALRLLIGALVVLVAAGWIADAFLPNLVDSHPLLLMTLNARTRNLVLVVNQVDVWAFFLVGTLRLLLSDPLFYLLGWWYGDRAVQWIERRSKTYGHYARSFERFFQKAAYPLVFIAPNNPICLLAGASGMRPAIFLALNISGTITRLWLIVLLGEAFEKPIDWVLDFIATYRPYLLVLTIGIVVITVFREFRSNTGDIEVIRELEQELDDEIEHEQKGVDEP